VQNALCILIQAYMLVLIVRAIMSWFPLRGDSPFAPVYRIVYDVTEPALAPLRRIIPPAGMFDLSFIVLWIGLFILRNLICNA
jgi:YggT family protein